MFRHFISDESGAVTTDWVMVTAGVCGLGLAVVGVVSGGVQSLSGETSDTMTGISINRSFFSPGTLLATDFAAGIGEWIGGSVVDVPGFGNVLQLGPGELTQVTMSIPPGAQTATISFDMLGIDDLSGEAATVFINGQAVALYSDNHGNITMTDHGVSGVSVSMVQNYNNDPVGGGSHGHDSSATFTLVVDNPGESLTFGVGSGTGQPLSEEFYAIDNVEVVSG
jgi:hypothetical protein